MAAPQLESIERGHTFDAVKAMRFTMIPIGIHDECATSLGSGANLQEGGAVCVRERKEERKRESAPWRPCACACVCVCVCVRVRVRVRVRVCACV